MRYLSLLALLGLIVSTAILPTVIVHATPSQTSVKSIQTIPPVKTKEELEARITAGSTSLDAFTPFGRREFLASIRWGSKGISSFSTSPIRRELSVKEAIAIFQFVGMAELAASYAKDRAQQPSLRLAEPTPQMEKLFLAFEEWRDSLPVSSEEAIEKKQALTKQDNTRYLQYIQENLSDLLTEPALRNLSDTDLFLTFQIISNIASLTLEQSIIHQQRSLYQKLQERHIDTRRSIDKQILSVFIDLREFDQAREFITKHPHLNREKIPRVIDHLPKHFSGRSVFRYEPKNNTLHRQELKLTDGRQLVMVVGAGCHFSREALTAISKDRDLFEKLKNANLLITTAPSESAPLFFLETWNKNHASMPVLVPGQREEWREIDLPAVPMFHFFEDGKLTKTIAGWNGQTTIDQLRDFINKKVD